MVILFRISHRRLMKYYRNPIRPFSIGLRHFIFILFGGFLKITKKGFPDFLAFFLCIVKHIFLNINPSFCPSARPSVRPIYPSVCPSELAILFWTVTRFRALYFTYKHREKTYFINVWSWFQRVHKVRYRGRICLVFRIYYCEEITIIN